MDISPDDFYVSPDDFWGTRPAVEEELVYIEPAAVDPMAGVRVVQPGGDLSTIKVDPTSGVRDSRTPEELAPVEKVLAYQLAVVPDRLRLARAHITDFGAVTLWELLEPDQLAVQCHYVASYVAGANRLQLVYAKKLEDGLRRFEAVEVAHRV